MQRTIKKQIKESDGLDELVTFGSGISRAFLSAPDTVLIDS